MSSEATMAFDDAGSGIPVVFLHGLTFKRGTWQPIIDRLGPSVRSIAVDLPAHGDSAGPPQPMDQVVARLHELLESLGAERPIVVGHSMSGGLACLYAASFPTLGIAVIDNGPDIRPFARLVQQLEPRLRGPDFTEAWQMFESSLGVDRIPEPSRSLVLANHEVNQDVVVGYWEELLSDDPNNVQARVDSALAKITVPLLGIFGRPISDAERERFERLPELHLEEWNGDGHFVHLVQPDRCAAALQTFITRCASADQVSK